MSASNQESGFHFQDPAVSEAEREKGLKEPLGQEAYDASSSSGVSSDGSEQAGTKKIEAITSSWSKWGLIVAYISYVTCNHFSQGQRARLIILYTGCCSWPTPPPSKSWSQAT
jgi:hypothetical protein